MKILNKISIEFSPLSGFGASRDVLCLQISSGFPLQGATETEECVTYFIKSNITSASPAWPPKLLCERSLS